LSTDTSLSVESIPGRSCKPAQFVDPAENVHKRHAAGRTYIAASSEDAGAGNRYETQLFVVAGSCLAVRYFIHYAAIENFDPGTVKAFDRARLLRTFDAIRATSASGTSTKARSVRRGCGNIGGPCSTRPSKSIRSRSSVRGAFFAARVRPNAVSVACKSSISDCGDSSLSMRATALI